MANRELNVVLGLKLGEFQAGLMKAEKQLKRFGDNMARTGRELTQSLTLPILGVGAGAIKAFTDIERLEKGLAAVMGSSEAAAIELRNLQEVAKLPGLGFEEAVQGSIRLQAVGLSANEARETLSAFGAAIAATGGTAQNLESVQYQLTQMISKNRILQEDFGIIQENVPLVGKAIEAAFGTRNVEQIRATGISAQEFNRRIVEALRTLPETQAAVGGLGNAFENFGDSVKVSFAELGRSINTALNLEGVLDGLANVVQNVVDYFKGLSPEAQRFIVISAAVVAAIGPMMFIFGQLIAVGTKVIAVVRGIGAAITFMLSPVGLTAAAVVAAVAALVYFYNESENTRKVINGLADSLYSLISLFKAAKNGFEGVFAALRGDTKSASSSFVSMSLALVDFKKQVGEISFDDPENRIKGSVEKIKGFLKSITGSKGITDVSGTGLPVAPTAPTGGLDPYAKMRNFKPIELISTKNLIEGVGLIQQTTSKRKDDVLLYGEQVRLDGEKEYYNRLINATEEEKNEILTRQSFVYNNIKNTIGTLFDGVFKALQDGTNVFKAIGQSIKQLVVQLIKAVAQAAILAGIMALLGVGGTGGGFLSSIFKIGDTIKAGGFGGNFFKLLGFANGGLVTGPTLGLIGEGVGTSMSNPEVVAPLDKLRSILDSSMGGGQFVASTRLQGSDLLLVVERAERNRGR